MIGHVIKTIIAISVISILTLGMSILPMGVYAQGDAYSKGYKDALCGKLSCNGHGYNPSCPGDHSSEYCNNYRDGYAAGWDASPANNNNDNSQRGSGEGQSQSQTTPDINIHIGPQSKAQLQSQASGN
jgi:hypothetical protein